MSLYKTEAVVLRHRDYGEADKILTLFGREEGKIQAIARGARRTRSRLAGASLQFTVARYLLYRGKSLDTVSQCEVSEPFAGLRSDLARMAYASYMAELLDELIKDRDPHPEAYDLFLAGLRQLEAGVAHPDTVRHLFEFHLLDLAGFRPELDQCVSCNAPLEERVRLSPALGGLVCGGCAAPDAVPVGPGTVQTMRALANFDMRRAAVLRLPAPVRDELDRASRSYISHILERQLKSLPFLDLVRQGSEGGRRD